jgi:hypothetical protein
MTPHLPLCNTAAVDKMEIILLKDLETSKLDKFLKTLQIEGNDLLVRQDSSRVVSATIQL